MMLRLDPEAIVQDGHPPVLVRSGEADVDPAGRTWTKTDGIVNQLPDREVQPVAISPHRRRQHVEAEVDRQVGEASLLLLDHGFHQLDQIDVLFDHRRAQLIEPPDQAHIHDQATEVPRFLIDPCAGQFLVFFYQAAVREQ